jgi:hypothetical protein
MGVFQQPESQSVRPCRHKGGILKFYRLLLSCINKVHVHLPRCPKYCYLPLAGFIVFLTSTGTTPRPITVEESLLPVTYGEILYSTNGASPRQLYIVGISHEDTLTGANSPYTPRVEAEVYRIGAWLAQNKGIELLLPEGFFAGKPKTTSPGSIQKSGAETRFPEVDMKLIEQILSANSRSLNAEMLLSENFGMELKQVEERELYWTVNKGIRQLADCTNLQRHYLIRSDLDYHQDRRVGAMLQKIPQVINEAFRAGHVRKERALFTIGLSHIPSILRFVREKKLAISCPIFPLDSAKYEECRDGLNLAQEDFGITVILPRTLADDARLMKRNRIKIS